MSDFTIDNLTMAFGGQDVLTGVTAAAPRRARIGIVGPNGAGKSTLLRLIAGLDQPTGGAITIARDSRVVYVAQEPEVDAVASVYGDALQVFTELRALERAVEEAGHRLAEARAGAVAAAHAEYDQLHYAFDVGGGYTYESDVKRVLTGLGLPAPYWNRPAAGLSGGERARLALARALLRRPDVLLLDEPTNHLDLLALGWLEDFLLDWPGTLIVVSHDRYFLDRVIDRIWELRDGRVTAFPGNYSAYARQREERDLRQRELFERQQAEIERTEEFIRRYRAGQRAKQARGRQKQLDRLERVAAVGQRATLSLAVDAGSRSGGTALRLQRLQVEHPARRGEPLLTLPEKLEVERGRRVAIVGPNGAGKTTLLRTIAGEIAPLLGRVELGHGVRLGFFRQAAEDLNPEDDMLTAFLGFRNRPLAEARDLLARFLFPGEEIFKRVGDLSGGERVRLALARVFGSGANLLLLDEPTNHLDLPSREALEGLLPGFPGAIIFVSHDRRFIDHAATDLWQVEDGRIVSFAGGWTDYLERQAQRASIVLPPERAAAPEPSHSLNGADGRPQSKESRRRAARVRELEREVADAEEALAALHASLDAAVAAHDGNRVGTLGEAVVAAQRQLDELLAAWETAALAV